MALRSKGRRLVDKMLEELLKLPPGTKKLKDNVLLRIGSIRSIVFLNSKREINEAWEIAKKRAAKNHPDIFILDDRNILNWNDGSVKILDKKITRTNFKKLNELAEKEGVSVNAMVSKLITLYKKKK